MGASGVRRMASKNSQGRRSSGSPTRHGSSSPSGRSRDGSPFRDDPDKFDDDDDGDDELHHDDAISRGLITPAAVGAPALFRADVIPDSDSEKKESTPKRQLKTKFFRSWEDFVNFDQNIKHQMPITLSEFDLVLEKREESNTGWDVCVERPEITISKMQGAEGVITLRAWAKVPGVHQLAAFISFYDLNRRMSWDKVFSNMKLIGEGMSGSELLYSNMKFPAVTNRDFMQYRRVKVLDDGTIVIVLRSAEHPEMPEQSGVIRAESYIGGYVLKQLYDSSGQPVLDIFLMSCNDVKGMIPKWIISYFAPKAPKE